MSEVKAPKIAAGDFQPSFSMDNLFKDLKLAKAQANKAQAVLPAAELVIDEFAKAVAQNEGKQDFSVIARQIMRLNGLTKN